MFKLTIVIIFSFYIGMTKADTLYVDNRIILTGDSTLKTHGKIINKHMNIINNIWRWCESVPENTFIEKPDTTTMKYVTNVNAFGRNFEYFSLPFGDASIQISNNNVYSLGFYGIKTGKYSSKEYTDYQKTKRIPDSFRNLTNIQAIDKSKEFITMLLYECNAGYGVTAFDSITIKEYDSKYIVNLRCKWKNDIRDPRFAEIWVCAKTGIISNYCGELIPSYSFDYKPKISKEEAINIAKQFFTENKDSVESYEAYLNVGELSRNKWGWNVVATISGKMFDYRVIIDSETGEIVFKLRY